MVQGPIPRNVRLGPGARIQHQWREYPGPPHFYTGPSLSIAENRLTAANRTLLELPGGRWVHFEIEAGHGEQARPTWRLTATLPGEPPHTFNDLPIGSPENYRRLTWLGFVSAATADAVFWIDNVRIELDGE